MRRPGWCVGVLIGVLCGGCGRISFDPQRDGLDGAAPVDAARDGSGPDGADRSDASSPDAETDAGGVDDCPPTGAPCRDPSFAGGGIVAFDLDGAASPGFQIQGVAAHRGGYVLVASTGNAAGGTDCTVFRVDGYGEPDPTFGGGGRTTIDVGMADVPHSVTVMEDGRIVVSGTSDERAFVVRLTDAGVRDATFASGGMAFADYAPMGEVGNGVAVLPADDRILVGGQGLFAGEYDLAVARLLADGSGLDPTFGTAGVFRTGASGDEFGTMTRLPTGQILLSGSRYEGDPAAGGTGFDCVLLLVSALGAREPGFGSAPGPTYDVAGQTDRCPFASPHPLGGFVAAGYTTGTSENQMIVRVRSDATLQTDFGASGFAILDAPGDDQARSLAVLRDGRIVVGGYRADAGIEHATLWVVEPSGSVDTARLIRVIEEPTVTNQVVVSLLAEGINRVVVLLHDFVPGSAQIAITRYLL